MKDPVDRETSPDVHQGEETGKGVGGQTLGSQDGLNCPPRVRG